MRRFTLPAHTAQIAVTRQACDCREPEVGCHHSTCTSFEPVVSWVAGDTQYTVGEQVHIVAGEAECGRFGEWIVYKTRNDTGHRMHQVDALTSTQLHPGCVVGSARIQTTSIPIHGVNDTHYDDVASVELRPDGTVYYYSSEFLTDADVRGEDISDQVHDHQWTPGHFATQLADAEACEPYPAGEIDEA